MAAGPLRPLECAVERAEGGSVAFSAGRWDAMGGRRVVGEDAVSGAFGGGES